MSHYRRFYPTTIFLLLLAFIFTTGAIRPGFNVFPGNSPEDSVKLANYKKLVETSMRQEGDTLTSDNGEVTHMGAGFSGIIDGYYYYAPDSFFKVFVVEGEGCGAYCNPFWVSYLETNKTGRVFAESGFSPIQSIHRMTDGKYLVLQQSYGRPAGYYSVMIQTATLISFEGDSLRYHPIHYNHPQTGENIDEYNTFGSLSFAQENEVPGDMLMEWDANNQRLNYIYGSDFRICCYMDSAFIYTGYFQYEKGELKLKSESAEGMLLK